MMRLFLIVLDTEVIKPGVKPVSQWAGPADPIALTEGMCNHLPGMWAALEVKRIRWPQLRGQDLADMLVYLRNLPDTREKRGVFETSVGTKREAIFKSKGVSVVTPLLVSGRRE